jgi:glycosyltransferase involved in cell wall biosynthesis
LTDPDLPASSSAGGSFRVAGAWPTAANLHWPARPGERRRRPEVAILVDPRFPGGTAGAVAAEIAALAPHVDLAVHALRGRMFEGRADNALLADTLAAHGIPLIEDARVVRAEVIALHNPSCLKRDTALDIRLSCARLFVVTHENFLRPGGAEGFDVAHCLGLVEAARACGAPALAPISPINRAGVAAWTAARGGAWPIAAGDWFNIIDLPLTAPSPAPRDRRGRHSRPGFEKFPLPRDMLRQFPAHAESCAILGADALLLEGETPPRHWKLHRFNEIEPARFLAEIDFFVYFTNPLWRESFGRVIAEAIAAGKVVITDPATASVFGEAVIADPEGGRGETLDRVIAEFIANPARYGRFVRAAQASLARFRPEAFVRRFLARLETEPEPADAPL